MNENENTKKKKKSEMRGEILDEALGGVDARFVKAAEDPGAAFAAAGAGRPRRPVWLRYAVAAAVTLILLVAAGFSVFIVNSVIRGSHGEETGTDADAAETADPSAADPRTGDWTIELGDAVCIGCPGAVEYSCRMSVEDQELVLGIWNRYEHPEGVWDCIPDAYFRLTDDTAGGVREYFEMSFTRDPKGYLLCYHKVTDLNDPEKEHWVNTYAFISDADTEVIFGMTDRYRPKNVDWWLTSNSNGEVSRLTIEDWESFREIWLDNRRLLKNPPVPSPSEDEASSLIGTRIPIYHLVSSQNKYTFLFYRDLRLIALSHSYSSGGELIVRRDYTYISEEDAAALAEMMTHYGIRDEAEGSEIYNAGYIFPEVASGKWTGESDASGSGSLPLFIIDSTDELEGFMTRFKGAFDPDRPREEDGVTFAQGIAGYDAGFFVDNSLVIVLIEATSGEDRFGVGAVVRGGYSEPPHSVEDLLSSTINLTSAVMINIVQTVDGDTDNMGAWLAVIPVSKTRLEQEDGRCYAYITWIAG
ncbi:MAG: hypothetical protein K5647_07725 [Clostridiales bacterium]|nr:hypothetical protein [Clostridiales bacterium]